MEKGIIKQETELQRAIQRISVAFLSEVLSMVMSLMLVAFMSVLCGHIGGYKAKEANNASVELYVTYNDGQNTLTTLLTGDAERDQTKRRHIVRCRRYRTFF